MWCPVDGGGTAFYARRFTHETAIHRADAAIALGIDYVLDTDVAVDGVDEWLELGCLPFHFEVHPWMRELLGPDRTIGLHATDTDADWLLDFTGDVIAWRRSDAAASAADARIGDGSAADDLSAHARRLRPIEVTGDAELSTSGWSGSDSGDFASRSFRRDVAARSYRMHMSEHDCVGRARAMATREPHGRCGPLSSRGPRSWDRVLHKPARLPARTARRTGRDRFARGSESPAERAGELGVKTDGRRTTRRQAVGTESCSTSTISRRMSTVCAAPA